MAEFNWEFDSDSGIYKNHALSDRLRHAAIAETVGLQFVTPEGGYGKKRGESITITRISNMAVPTDGRLSESRRMPEDEVVLSTRQIVVSEWGRAVPYTSLSQDLGKFDPNNYIQKELRKQMRQTLDNAVFEKFTDTDVKIKAIPDGASSLTFDTDGTASTQATVNLAVFHLEQIRDYLFSTLEIEPFVDGNYMCLLATKAKRGVMSDPSWKEWHVQNNEARKFNSELGNFEGFKFVEIARTAALSGSLGASSVLGEAIMFGEDAMAMAVAEDPHLRMGNPEDFGRKKSVAWYGILEFGVVWDTANVGEARIVHVTSS